MFPGLKAIFFGLPVSYETPIPSDIALEKIASSLNGGVFSLFARMGNEGVFGEVEGTRIILDWNIPFFGNPLKPTYYGQFCTTDTRTILEGKYTVYFFNRVFALVWLIGVVALAITPLILNVSGAFPFILFCIGFFVFGIVGDEFSWWLSRKDIGRIENFIITTLDAKRIDNRA